MYFIHPEREFEVSLDPHYARLLGPLQQACVKNTTQKSVKVVCILVCWTYLPSNITTHTCICFPLDWSCLFKVTLPLLSPGEPHSVFIELGLQHSWIKHWIRTQIENNCITVLNDGHGTLKHSFQVYSTWVPQVKKKTKKINKNKIKMKWTRLKTCLILMD